MNDPLIYDSQLAERVLQRYARYPLRDVSVATVRDYCDSWDNLHSLSALAGDLKDVQRPWMLKALIASVPPGGRICEIGAGEPFVAGILNQWGYEVWVVDPYDGSGHGPTDFEAYAARYPGIRFVRRNFGSQMAELEDGYFDATYSISVLEHVPIEPLADLCHGIRRYTRHRGCSIHAIDHVLRGAGDSFHHTQLMACADGLGIARAAVDQVLRSCELDSETYFLSAESHNRWRGATDYDAFPMRKVVSVNLFARLA